MRYHSAMHSRTWLRSVIGPSLIGGVAALSACTSLPADMGKSNYEPPYLLCQCGNHRTALDPATPHPLGSACPCDPALRATTGTVVHR
jgi:hypothetical protein